MSTTIDQRVVEMRFDNKQFESNVADTMSTVDKLKQKLNLTGAAKGLESVGTAARGINLSPLSNAADVVAVKFSYMQMSIQHQLNRIVDGAVSAGKRIVSALTIDPIKTGFSEYETKIGSIQTILANTSSKGTTMEDVTRVIGELNTYADKTIYNFAEMTRNIGTFTAAGIGLEESATAIQGIANLAAVSGSNSQQASTAMYQLSQAMASGTVKLMDWNSVVNAGMGGQVFQDALKATARAHGVAVDAMIEKAGSFRESLSEGWITTEILTETLAKMTKSGAAEYLSELTGVSQDQITAAQQLVATNKDGTATYEELAEQLAATGKISKEDAIEILKMADTAEDAATKVKTFTQLWDTLKESAQSGWSQSWEILIGDFEEAKELLTNVSDVIGGMINDSAQARNDLLQGWKDAGGRDDLIVALANSFKALMSIVTPIKEAFREIFPPITVEQLVNFTEGLRKLTEKFTLIDVPLNKARGGIQAITADTEAAIAHNEKITSVIDKITRVFKGFFSLLSIVAKAIKALVGGFFDLSGAVLPIGGSLLDAAAALGDWFTNLNKSVEKTNIFSVIVGKIVGVLKKVIDKLRELGGFFKDKIAMPGWEGFLSIMSNIWGVMQKIGSKIAEVGASIGEALSHAFRSGDLSTGIDLFNSGMFGMILFGIKGFISDLKETVSGGEGILSGIKEIKDSVVDTFGALQAQLKSEVLIKIATAIAILAVSLLLIATINPDRLSGALLSISILFADLAVTMKSISKMDKLGGVVKTVGMMIAMSIAVLLLAAALKTISTMSLEEMTVALIGIIVLMGALVQAVKLMGDAKGVAKGAGQMILMAVALKILASVCKDLGALKTEELIKGVLGITAILGAFVGFQALMKAIKPEKMLSSALSLILIGAAMEIFADICSKFGDIEWVDMGKAGAALAGVLVIAAGFALLSKFGGKMISSAVALVIIGAAMEIFADVCSKFGNVNWSALGKAGAAMAGVLVFAAVLGLIGNYASGMILGAVGLVIIGAAMETFADVCSKFNGIDWSALGKAGAAMAGVLVFAAVLSLLGSYAAGMILGAIGLNIIAASMETFADVCSKFASMDWSGLAKAGVAVAGILLLAVGFGALAGLAPGMIVGAASLLVMAAALSMFTPVLVTLGAMSWEAIGKGLLAIAGAFVVLGVAGLLLAPLTPAILGLSAALFLFGIACTAIGAGIYLLAAGFMMLATAGSSGAVAVVSALTIIITGIVSLIPVVCAKLGEGVVAFATAIANGAVAIAAAVVQILVCILTTVNNNIGTITEAAVQIIASFVQGIANNIGQVVDAAADLIVNFINGITQCLPDIIASATELISSFISGIVTAIETLIPDLVTAGGDILDAVFDGVVQAVELVAEGLGSVIGSFVGSILSGITESVAEVDVSVITSKATEFFSAAQSLIDNVVSGIKSGSSNVDTAAASIATGALTSISNKSGEFTSVGETFIAKLATGINNKGSTVQNAASSTSARAVAGARSKYNGMYAAGQYLGQGLINGIYSKMNAVYQAAYELGQEAVRGEKEGQDSASPSKATIQAGEWLCEGLIIGIDHMGQSVYRAGHAIGENAVGSIAKSIQRVSSLIDSDMDMQPTIRPVVDLSDVSSGMSAIKSMFDSRHTIGGTAHLGPISAMMGGRQNRANDEVVSAIRDLNSNLSKMGNTYTVNGVTYDDGSNVAEAVRAIVRAARVERRV